MIGGSGFNIRKILLNLLFVSGVASSLYSQGTSIGGVINQYMSVVSIGGNTVTLTDASIFNPKDTVLLIQMKGAVILGSESNQYGTYQYSQGTTGAYEFLIIQSVNHLTQNIVFTRNLINIYDVSSLVQLIKVPYYNNVTVTTELKARPWDSVTTKTGGVLAMIVGGTLTLNDNINASGMGFVGGIPSPGDGICTITNSALYDKYAYPVSYTNSGYKGESVVSLVFPSTIQPLYPDFVKGKGCNFTGGGGGNGRFSGGGGGSGAGGIAEAILGSGGKGGVESDLVCGSGNQYGNGLGGKSLYNQIFDGILLGSGGGSSTYGSSSTATPGGSGGGIIIILCDTIKGNGKIISADGGTPAGSSSGSAGAGGGGGGGSVALCLQSFSTSISTSALTISVKGGNGGNANNKFGEGGGGGGGLILTNNISIPATVIMTAKGGSAGTLISPPSGNLHADPGSNGGDTTFIPVLNGFLFNVIHSSVTNSQIDSVCSNMIPPKIIGTKPVGGTLPYFYLWQKSYDSTFAFTHPLANDSTFSDYVPGLADAITPTDTVWFRRIVTSSGTLPMTDISMPVKIIVHKRIINNNVGSPDTICFNGNPPAIQQLMPDLVVPTIYRIAWQDSSVSGTWGTTLGTGKDYDPSPLAISTWYRRIVTSGSCSDTSHSVEMTVLKNISNNTIISPDTSVCFGLPFDSLKATTVSTALALGGGDNSYRFKWESNINGAGWITAQGNSSKADYKPPSEPIEKVPSNDYDYHRIVYSGSNDACIDTSINVHLRDFHTISGNIISPDNQLFCSGSVPIKLTGPQPNYGDGIYTYTWQNRTSSETKWTDIPGAVKITDPEYQPPALTDTTFFRRIAFATCVDSANSVRINIHPAITNNIVTLTSGGVDTTICNGQAPAGFIGTVPGGAIGNFTYQWLYSEKSPVVYVPVSDEILADYPAPSALVESTYYRRQVSSGACVDTSTAKITINVLAPVSNNIISSNQVAVCENTAPDQIGGSPPAGGDGGYLYLWEQSNDGSSWMQASGLNTSSGYQPPILSQGTWYRRNVISGFADCCSSISNELLISINPAPIGPVNAGPDESIFSTGRTYNMKADPPVATGETGFWTVLEPGSATVVNVSDSKTQVKHLSENKNLFIWTITNGLCNIEDSVTINLKPDFIPQGFSPNADNVNDKFTIEGLNLTQQTVDLTIVNGAGAVVFSASNRNGQQWVDFAGKNNSGAELPEGTYYYLLFYTGEDQPTAKKSGFIVLKRH